MFVLLTAAVVPGPAQERFFVGVVGGVATLSADARFELRTEAAASGYKPENGPAVSPFFGVHANEYLSFQASYMWNRNDVLFHVIRTPVFFEQRARTTHQLGVVDAMLYFRRRDSWARPYLAAGTGVACVDADAGGAAGRLPGAPGSFSECAPVLNVAVGIDLKVWRGWAFRYTFGETIQRNAFSRRLTPEGERNLAGFRNLFGFVKYF